MSASQSVCQLPRGKLLYQLPRGKTFCASYLEDVDVESIQKLCASVPTVPLPLPETSSSLGTGLDESSEGHA